MIKTPLDQYIRAFAIIISAAGVLCTSVYSQSSWDITSNGTWGNDGNWDPGSGYPDAAGTVVNFTNAIPGNRIVDLDVSPTAGILNFGGPNPLGAFTLSGAGVLTLDNGGVGQINFLSGSTTSHSIAGTINLAGNVTVNNQSNLEQRFGNGFAITSGGPVTLTNASAGTGDVRFQPTSLTTGTPNVTIVQNSATSRTLFDSSTTLAPRTFTGGITLLQGTIAGPTISNAARLCGSGLVTLTAGKLENVSTGSMQFDNSVLINGNVAFESQAGGSIRMLTTGSNSIDLGGATRTLDITESVVVTTQITNGGIIKEGAGTLQISNSNHTYSGGLTVNEGLVFLVTTGNNLGGGALTINNGATLDTNNITAGLVTVNNGTIASNDKSITSDVGFVVNSGSSEARFVGTGYITKTGSGTFALNGIIGATGVKTVNGGTLLINSTMNGANTITVNDGARLGGTGLINQPVVQIAAGGTLLGGDTTVGTTLTINTGLTLQTDSILSFALGAGGSKSSILRTTSNTWNFNDLNQAVQFIDAGVEIGEYTNLITGLTSAVDVSNWSILNAGWNGTFSYDSGSIGVTLSAVPEPSTWALLAGGVVILALVRRRKYRG